MDWKCSPSRKSLERCSNYDLNLEIEVMNMVLKIKKVLKKETLVSSSFSEKNKVRKYISTKIPGFDDLFRNGIPQGNTVLIAGGAGSGKTILCLQMLYQQALAGKKCFYVSFEESEERLIEHMTDFGWDFNKVKDNFVIKRYSPYDIIRNIDALLMKTKGELLINYDSTSGFIPKNFKPELLVLDSLTAVSSAFTGKEDSYRIYIEQLFRSFERVGSTSLFITETEQVPKIYSTSGVEEFLADGVVVLYSFKRRNIRENGIEILKMRGEQHQKKIVAMHISGKGIIVYPQQEVFGDID